MKNDDMQEAETPAIPPITGVHGAAFAQFEQHVDRNRRFINPEEAKKAYKDALQKIQDTGHLVFNPGSPFVSIEARCVFNAEKEKAPVEMPSKPGLFNPTRSTLDTFSANVRNEINKYLTDFGANNGFPVVYVLAIKNENGVGKVTCEINMYKKSDMHAALDFARRNGGELGIFNSVVEYIDELTPQPVLDGPLPKFCIAHHCTKRSKACDKCAYTAFSSSHRRWLEK